MRSCVWDELVAQPRAAAFLRRAASEGMVSHAYLFVGPPGAGKRTAAKALACALMCDDGGCGACPACHRVKRGFHPDVRMIAPEGSATYLVAQVREIVYAAHLAPVEGRRKVFIVDAADSMNDASANALLKTLEEPPEDVVFVLLASAYDAVLPTVASRCQLVRFSRIPPEVAVDMLVQRTGAERREAAAALAASGGVVGRALDFLRSPARREGRRRMLEVLGGLRSMDAHDVLDSVREVLAAVKAPLDEMRAVQADELRERAEFLGGKVSAKPIEERHKRELTAREREAVSEMLSVAETWLRDCLALSAGARELVVNADAEDAMEAASALLGQAGAARAIAAVRRARVRLSCNVSPQLALEAMFFDIQEV